MSSSTHFKALFLEAIELPSCDRTAFLDQAAGGDARLRQRVEKLLLAHDRAESVMTANETRRERRKTDSGPPLPSVLGNYELTEVISSGGSGVVYRAQQLDLGRTVAVKLLRSGRFATDHEVQRFKAEAEAAARLDHASIVPVYEVGSHEGRHFISMKLVDGPGMDRCLDRYVGDPRASAALLASVARAVDHAHRRGVLHRDIKPSNILLDADEVPHIVDFGTAKLLDDDQRHTMTGWFVGTPTSMAPEQVVMGGEVTVATDVYGLGCVLYELLVGRPPFAAEDLLETLREIREAPPPRPRVIDPGLNRDLETICLTCLAKDPARRYDSALALAEDLERWLAHEPIRARPVTAWERMQLAWQRKPVVATLAATVAVLMLVLVVGAIVTGFQLREGLARTREAERAAGEQTRSAYLAEARALRRGGLAGRRERALDLLRQANALRPGKDLVNEAAASLALMDLVTEREWTKPENELLVDFDSTLERYTICRENGTVEVRRSTDDKLLYALPGTGQPAWRARYSRDGRYLAVTHHSRFGTNEPRFRVWDLDRQKVVYGLDEKPRCKVDFAPDRAVLALVKDEGWLCEQSLDSGVERRLVQLEEGASPALVRYAPVGNRIAVADAVTGEVGVYSVKGAKVCSFEHANDSVTALSWSPDGSRIAVGSHDLNAYVFDAATGELITTLEGHRGEVVRTLFPAPGIVATYSWDRSSRLWEVDTGRQILFTEDVLISADRRGARLGFVSDSTIGITRLRLHSVLRTLHGHERKSPSCVAVSPSSDIVVSGGDTAFILWDLESGRRLDRRKRERVEGLLFTADGHLYVASGNGLERFRVDGKKLSGPPEMILEGRFKNLSSTADGSLLAALNGQAIHLLASTERGGVRRIDVPSRTLRVSLSPDGKQIAVGNWRGSGVRVYDAQDGAPIAHLWPGDGHCTPWFSPDGKHLVVGTEHEFHLHAAVGFDIVSSRSRQVSNNLAARVASYSPDGKRLAVLLGRSKIMLLDTATGRELVVLESPEPQIPNDCCFSPDGQYLIVATDSNCVLLWNIAHLETELSALGLPLDPSSESKR